MGGQSHATFKVDTHRRVGVFDGECKIVPSLKAPGFCNAEADAGFLHRMPDASATFNEGKGGLVYAYNSTGKLESFKVAFGTSLEYNFGQKRIPVCALNSDPLSIHLSSRYLFPFPSMLWQVIFLSHLPSCCQLPFPFVLSLLIPLPICVLTIDPPFPSVVSPFRLSSRYWFPFPPVFAVGFDDRLCVSLQGPSRQM